MRYKNNPFNIRYYGNNNWLGMSYPNNGFCEFTDIEFGVRAFFVIMRSYFVRGFNTPWQIIARFAPSSENDIEAYLNYVCTECLVPDKPITHIFQLVHLARRMAYYESSYKLDSALVYHVLSFYHIFDGFNFTPDNTADYVPESSQNIES